MKKILFIISIAFSAVAFISPGTLKSGIHGTIEPAEGARKVWAISGADSVSAIPVTGKFSIELKPGNWTLIVEAVRPYKNGMMENVLVVEGQSTDAGAIRLAE